MLMAANPNRAVDRIEEPNGGLEKRHRDLEIEHNCTIGDIQRHAAAREFPHPDGS
jgi:hypothetical protein